jgi:hypothetical protein
MSSLVLSGDTSGTITVAVPLVAGSNTFTIPAVTGTAVVAGQNSAITAGTAVASTSGTAISFTSIPSWVKRITVMLSGVSGSGTSAFLLQLGTSSGIDITGYVSTNAYIYSNPVMTTSTAGFLLTGANAATDTVFGQFVISNITDNNWVGNGSMARSVGDYLQVSSGGVTLDGELTQLRITTVNGTDTFDAGSINILYE